MSSREEFLTAAERVFLEDRSRDAEIPIDLDHLATLCYAARMHNESAISDGEYEKIIESIHHVEEALGIGYAFDSYYDDD